MQLLKKHGLIVFWMILFADCYFLFEQKYNYHAYAKLLLLPILIYFVFANSSKNRFIRSKTLVFIGMFAAWVGDALLLNSSDAFFIWGMVAFMIAHIFYAISFFRIQRIVGVRSYEVLVVVGIILASIYYQMFKFLSEDLDLVPQFKIPIYLYAAVIGIMALFASNIITNNSKRNLAIQYFLPGAVLFIASDAILVIFKFKYVDVQYLEVIVMLTYGYAQCLLAEGFGKFLKG